MWIVKIALQRPYTFIMLALLIVFLGVFAILKTPADIFPNINIPITAVIWRCSVTIQMRRLNASVLLVKALGGGWRAQHAAAADDVRP
jgi:hypothetical protein